MSGRPKSSRPLRPSISFSTTTTSTPCPPAGTCVNRLNSPRPPTAILRRAHRQQEPRTHRRVPRPPPGPTRPPNPRLRQRNRRAGGSAAPIDPLMSYDILAFDPGAAPGDDDLLAWYQKQAEWSEPHSYD